jgi:antitoxin component of RelBE/YafQ-DinJ toxin-antitoxin module
MKSRRVEARLDNENYEKFQQLSKKLGISQSNVIRMGINRLFEEEIIRPTVPYFRRVLLALKNISKGEVI